MHKLLPTLFLSFVVISAGAQNASCDGNRYINEVFSDVTKTTVQYATAPSYFPAQSIGLEMDIYEPAGDMALSRPAVVLAHGGTFIFGDKSNMENYCEDLAKKGYVAVSIQYRLYPVLVLGWPDSVDIMDAAMKAVGDMKAAVRFLRQDADTDNLYKVDPDHVFIGGYSAGAVAALHFAYLDADQQIPMFMQTILDANGGLQGNTGDSLNQSYSAQVSAVLSMSGGLYRSSWVDPDEPPLSSIHGTADNTVYYTSGIAAGIAYLEGSSLIHSEAATENVWENLVTVDGGGHTDVYSDAEYLPDLNNFLSVSSTLMESIVCSSTSLTETINTPFKIEAFPNPATDQIRFDVPQTWNAYQVRVYDLNGSQVLVKNLRDNPAALNVAQLPGGMYLVQVQSDVSGDPILTGRFILEK